MNMAIETMSFPIISCKVHQRVPLVALKHESDSGTGPVAWLSTLILTCSRLSGLEIKSSKVLSKLSSKVKRGGGFKGLFCVDTEITLLRGNEKNIKTNTKKTKHRI